MHPNYCSLFLVILGIVSSASDASSSLIVGDSFYLTQDAKVPGAFLIFPGDSSSFSMNVKYDDYSEIFGSLDPKDIKKCYVVPRSNTFVYVNASGSGVAVYSIKEGKKGISVGECPDIAFSELQACQVVGPCASYDVSELKCSSGPRIRTRDADADVDKLREEVEKLKRELSDRDKVLEVFIIKARSAQKWIAAIYFILGIVFTLTVSFLLKVRGMRNGSRPYSSSFL